MQHASSVTHEINLCKAMQHEPLYTTTLYSSLILPGFSLSCMVAVPNSTRETSLINLKLAGHVQGPSSSFFQAQPFGGLTAHIKMTGSNKAWTRRFCYLL